MSTVLAIAVAGTTLALLPAPVVKAGTGDFTASFCYRMFGRPPEGCSLNSVGSSPSKPVVSEDGVSLYVRRLGGVDAYRRNQVTGALNRVSCYGRVTATENIGCTNVPVVGQPYDVVVSEDGKAVYVSSSYNAIVVFVRDTTTGVLTYSQCHAAAGGPQFAETANCFKVPALEGVGGLAVTADGTTLAATLSIDDGVAWFDRDPSTGKMNFRGCLLSRTGRPPCAFHEGLTGATNIELSRDSRSVYVAGVGTLVALRRDPVSKQLWVSQCFRNLPSVADGLKTGPASCFPVVGLGFPTAIASSKDGRSIYVTASQSDAVSLYARATDGAIVPAGCWRDIRKAATGCTSVIYTARPSDVAVSDDDRSVYVTGSESDSIALFVRNISGGRLTADGCLLDVEHAGLGCTNVQGFDGAAGVDVTPDGRFVYVTSSSESVIVVISREVTVPGGLLPEVVLPETEIDSGPEPKSNRREATFTFSSATSGATFECSLDGADPVSCTSPHTVTGLGNGPHLFRVAAIDTEGNHDDSHATHAFLVKGKHRRRHR
jgi:DNA-binding beta-propeller fold protein YncE